MSEKSVGFDISEDDIIMLESLVQSPAFAALCRTLERYKKECFSKLLTEKDPPVLFELQGRVIGAATIANLPMILVHQRKNKNEAKLKKEQIEAKTKFHQV